MSKEYIVNFDLSPYDSLDKFALLADQKYNLGDKDDWFGCFRGGLYGFYARLMGIQIHFKAVHSWDFSTKTGLEEYHISSIFFNMDSAVECMVFALNALGYIACSSKFLDITDEKKLKEISPSNLLNPKKMTQGYDDYFPSLKKCWHENNDLLSLIFEQHDVSKHRSTIYVGGQKRIDPPSGFFEMLGLQDDKVKQVPFMPMAEILIPPNRKVPLQKRKHIALKDIPKLEDIAEKFCEFINTCGVNALADAKTNIKLKHCEFVNP